MENKTVALFGGTFNPVHLGHVKAAADAQQALCADVTVIMPTAVPPHKAAPADVAAEHRLAMTRAAFEGLKGFVVSDLEIRRGGASYTVDTAETLKKLYPGCRLWLVTGTDMFLTLESWKRAADLFSLCSMLTLARAGETGELDRLLQKKEEYEAKYGTECRVLETIPLPLSSTGIRAELAAGADGKRLRELVPQGTAEYIESHGLYRRSAEEKAGKDC